MRSEREVADIFRRHDHAYRIAHDGRLGRVEPRAMSAIELCRTAALGGHVEACEDCSHARVSYNSCRNRHCPKCQSATRERWLADRQADLLPVPYFHVVFTVPAEVAEIAFHNGAVVYAILFDAVAATLKTIAADPRHLGGKIRFLAFFTHGARRSPIISRRPMRVGDCTSPARSTGWVRPMPSRPRSGSFVARTGSSMPSRRSARPSKSSRISAAIPTGYGFLANGCRRPDSPSSGNSGGDEARSDRRSRRDHQAAPAL
ncbi:MAG: hypothetical protein EOQ99_32725 [Mesorhizobium sp.]|nr:MAG: hypothetical protein EOQ99_32725 [Mesorhizobium sp.]